eukprot:TRINITY_DN11044_c0_g1_i1.p1 TRINITY_DN11044_c0_g1~~TRINITY_DN11044_c0_g1_i1.p1  ORF type:complete len:407 (-),score=146.42 TRINITY_DN11044_c0_g1_i1:96-1316(-)
MASYGGQASDGMRAARHAKARQIEIEDSELRKRKLADSLKVSNIEHKFSAHYDAVEQQIKASTVGLVTIDQMKQTQERAMMEREKFLAMKEKEAKKEEKEKLKAKEKAKAKEAKKLKALSFDPDEEEDFEDEDEENSNDKMDKSKDDDTSPEIKKRRFGMNPDVDTAFLPDRDRDEEENIMREKLRQQWEEKQKSTKEEEVEITYSYWDGSGHRKTINMKKGNSIYQFLCKVLDSIRSEFPELKIVSGDQLMYVKEDLIIPQTNTFYDFIVSRARGKSGPLFNFDAHDDVRMVSDATIEKDESHAGKVILRSWYERNKHIFPASRWEPYDPTKTYSSYSTSGDSEKLDFARAGKTNEFTVGGEGEEETGSVLLNLAKGAGAAGCRGQCKCSKSIVCEMHYQAKNYR